MLLLLHGALGSKAQLDPLLKRLPGYENPVALNFPGHGGRPLEGAFSLKGFAESVLQYMDEHEVKFANIMGYSLGGYVALYLARWYPDRVSRVWTLNTKLDWSPESAARMQGMMNPEKIEAKAPEMAARLAAAHAPEDWKAVARHTSDFLKTLGEGTGLTDADFAQINHTVLLLRGTKDTVVSEEETERVGRLLPNGMTFPIPDSGHLPEQIDWSEVAAYWSL